VVAKVLEMLLAEAKQNDFEAEVVEREEGVVHRTLFSAVALLQGADLDNFLASWEGTVLWIAQSPYRKFHKRKNWFVGVRRLAVPEISDCDERDISFQTLRASGPGGQHVNKTETAVRATHLPSGISVVAADNRSQAQNKRLALERLQVRLAAREQEKLLASVQNNWQNHNTLQRGNPVKTIKKELDT
jgi:peptide chain release factor